MIWDQKVANFSKTHVKKYAKGKIVEVVERIKKGEELMWGCDKKKKEREDF